MSRKSFIRAVSSAALGFVAAGIAGAVPPAAMLSGYAPTIEQLLTVNPPNLLLGGYAQIGLSTTGFERLDSGTFNRPGNPQGGYAESSAYLGFAPSVFAEGVGLATPGNGAAFSGEVYEFEYLSVGTAPVAINFVGNDVIVASADPNAAAQALITIAPYGQLNDPNSWILQAGECVTDGVSSCVGNDNTRFQAIPVISAIHQVFVVPNVVYSVSLFAEADAFGAGVMASALVDPVLSVPDGTPGSLAFSEGVGPDVSPVPEPASWTAMIAGFGLIGAAARRRRHQPFNFTYPRSS